MKGCIRDEREDVHGPFGRHFNKINLVVPKRRDKLKYNINSSYLILQNLLITHFEKKLCYKF